ncbi:hypothetical protein Taro_028598 [Colocasia esculenta]|uniref:Uncharacterized protein n=1 Tax=Colocasia esculenta TaxID=4460 RepID=A0A843VHN5_COLES|nr:hypothetical protein [Colocasia esculenta]
MTTSGPTLGGTVPRCTRGTGDRLTLRGGSPRSRRAELDRAQQMVGGASSSREDLGRSVLEGQLASAVARAEDALAQLRERAQELRTALVRTTTLEAEMAELRLRPEAAEVTRWREAAEEASRWRQEAEAEAAARWQQEAEEAARLRTEAGDLRTQLGEERHRCDMLRSEIKGLERALALVGRSRSAASRSDIPSGSAGHYLTGSSRRQRRRHGGRRERRRVVRQGRGRWPLRLPARLRVRGREIEGLYFLFAPFDVYDMNGMEWTFLSYGLRLSDG